MGQTQAFLDISAMDLDALLSRAKTSLDTASATATLDADDVSCMIKMAESYACIFRKIEKGEIKNMRLMKLLGILPKSEKSPKFSDKLDPEEDAEALALELCEKLNPDELDALIDQVENKKSAAGKNRSKHGKRNASAFKDAEVMQHPMTDFSSGCVCEECGRGKLYKFEPSTFVRIIGQVPLQGTVHVRQQMRCNHCLKVYKANLPEELVRDGAERQRFGYSAVAVVALLKYAAAFPWQRLSDLQAMLGTKVSPSSLWDMMERLANCLKPLHDHLKILAASAQFYKIDDTGNRIINIDPVLKKRRNSDKEQLRTGIHSSGLIAKTQGGHDIILFKTGIGHAGEFFDEILEMRPDDAGTFVYMSDALSSNNPSKREGVKSLCNAHCRRQFEEIEEKYPLEVKHVIDTYKQVYKVDKECKKAGLSPAGRLEKHKDQSLPLMQELVSWAQGLLDDRKVEPNSALGDAMGYLIKHHDHLLTFTRVEGASLDNNEMESALRTVVLARKNQLHFKEQIGARVSDIITSVCLTAEAAEVNCFDYLTSLQRHSEKVKASPDEFLPWNYRQTVERMAHNETETSSA